MGLQIAQELFLMKSDMCNSKVRNLIQIRLESGHVDSGLYWGCCDGCLER